MPWFHIPDNWRRAGWWLLLWLCHHMRFQSTQSHGQVALNYTAQRTSYKLVSMQKTPYTDLAWSLAIDLRHTYIHTYTSYSKVSDFPQVKCLYTWILPATPHCPTLPCWAYGVRWPTAEARSLSGTSVCEGGWTVNSQLQQKQHRRKRGESEEERKNE